MPQRFRNTAFFLALFLLVALPVLADRTILRPGFNLFSTQQDTEMGRVLANEAESILPLVTQPNATSYIAALGSQLAVHAPGERYPYQFKIIDDDTINSFALPGGFIYVTSGLIEAAESEPQLAGVLAHQIGHVVLRHGTQHVSNTYRNRGSNRGRPAVNAVMADLDLRFDADSFMLKHSLEAERQADVIATQILHDARFDPRQMTQVFQTLANEPSSVTREFFGSHPNPANRAARVRTEIQNMGGLPRNIRGDSGDFHSVKERLFALNSGSPRFSTDPRDTGAHSTGAQPTGDLPSNRTLLYRGRDLQFRYPDNWSVDEQADGIYVTPQGGIVSGGLAYGMKVATFEPSDGGFFGRTPFATPEARPAQNTLSRATDELIDDFRRSNPNMRVVRNNQNRRVDGTAAMTIEIENDSPLGGQETNWVVTTLRPSGTLYYFVGVAPQRDFNRYLPSFEQMVTSVRFMD
jgi:Zn-dependent protease with chaperone function